MILVRNVASQGFANSGRGKVLNALPLLWQLQSLFEGMHAFQMRLPDEDESSSRFPTMQGLVLATWKTFVRL